MADIQNFPLLIRALVNENEILEHNRLKKTMRSSSNPMDLPEHIFRNIYRCEKETAQFLIDEISPYLPEQERRQAIPKPLIVLCAMHFYAQGSYQKGVGQDMNCPMSQASVSRCIDLVTDVLINQFNHEIKFPATDAEKATEKENFFQAYGGVLPGIIGILDGTHIRIQAPPTENEQFPGILFYNRKGYYSLNTQIICGADYKILGVNPRYPGSVHDSGIWATSAIRNHLVNNYNNGDRSSWLLGDSGYPLEPWLMTPFLGANLNDHQRQFNNAFKHIRNLVERVIGILKSRFRCCFSHRTLHYDPVKAAKIVSACCILHNIFIRRRDLVHENEFDGNIDQDAGVVPHQGAGRNYLNEGRVIRDRIVRDYF